MSKIPQKHTRWNSYPIVLPNGKKARLEARPSLDPEFVAALLVELRPSRFRKHLATARRQLRQERAS